MSTTAKRDHDRPWPTVLLSGLCLGVGLPAGYAIRPTMAPLRNPVTTPEAVAASSTPRSAAEARAATRSVQPTDSPAIGATASVTDTRAALVSDVLARVRPFRGDSEAPVTVIEFGDFQ